MDATLFAVSVTMSESKRKEKVVTSPAFINDSPNDEDQERSFFSRPTGRPPEILYIRFGKSCVRDDEEISDDDEEGEDDLYEQS
jgi:hypothetical protein